MAPSRGLFGERETEPWPGAWGRSAAARDTEAVALTHAETVLLRALAVKLMQAQCDAEALRLGLLVYLIDMARLEAERVLKEGEE